MLFLRPQINVFMSLASSKGVVMKSCTDVHKQKLGNSMIFETYKWFEPHK